MAASPISPFVVLPVGYGGGDIVLLALLGAAAEQDDQPLAILAEIDPITGAECDPEFENAGTDAFDVREITQRKPGQSRRHLRGGLRVQAVEPGLVGVAASRIEIFPNIYHQLS